MKITDNFSCRHCWDNHITVEFATLPKDWTRVKCDHCGKYTWVKYFDNDAAHRVLTSCKRPPKIHLYNSACWHNTVITVSNPLLVDCKHCQKWIIKRLEARGWRNDRCELLVPPVGDKRNDWTAKWIQFGKLRVPSYLTPRDL